MDSISAQNTTVSLHDRDPELRAHIKALGLESVEQYQAWCARNDFSVRIDKHWRERGKERWFASQEAIKARLSRKRKENRSPRQVIEEILAGQLADCELTQPYLALIQRTAASIESSEVRDAFRQLLIHALGCTDLLSMQRAIPQFGNRPGNTFIEGLLALARTRSHWIRPAVSWEPRSHNTRRQFSALARHLLAKYPVPQFLDSAWFKGGNDEAVKQQGWFRGIGVGTSVRELDLPIRFTKRMAHHFLQAPSNYSIEAALRWGQIIGLGGTPRLVKAVLGSRLGIVGSGEEALQWGQGMGLAKAPLFRATLESRHHPALVYDDFWNEVIRWLAENPLFDPAQVGPLIDFIHRQKFEPHEVLVAPGVAEFRPPDPDFSIKGRTPASLLRQMREWHVELRKESNRPQLTWRPSSIGGFEWTEGSAGTNDARKWTIIELLSRKELFDEGRAMRHCVASYESSCAFGGTSIWSLSVERNLGRRIRTLTIEVSNRSRLICQVRGKANRLPKDKELKVLLRWAAQENLQLSSHLDR